VRLYGLVYGAIAGVVAVHAPEPLTLGHAIYCSGIPCATVGYGDLLPAPRTRLFALTEGIVGAFTMGFFVLVLANRLPRKTSGTEPGTRARPLARGLRAWPMTVPWYASGGLPGPVEG
jgi:hypothetical protein